MGITFSDCKVIRAAPLLILQEGVPYDDLGYTSRDEVQMKKSRMEELARSVAVDEPSDEVQSAVTLCLDGDGSHLFYIPLLDACFFKQFFFRPVSLFYTLCMRWNFITFFEIL